MLKKIQFLLVEDNPADVRLVKEGLKEIEQKIHLNVIGDGAEAINFLWKEGKYANQETPQLIFLDLNIPKENGKDVLRRLKADASLKSIPVIILTSTSNPSEIKELYELCANCFVTKPTELDQFLHVISSLSKFWTEIAQLPNP